MPSRSRLRSVPSSTEPGLNGREDKHDKASQEQPPQKVSHETPKPNSNSNRTSTMSKSISQDLREDIGSLQLVDCRLKQVRLIVGEAKQSVASAVKNAVLNSPELQPSSLCRYSPLSWPARVSHRFSPTRSSRYRLKVAGRATAASGLLRREGLEASLTRLVQIEGTAVRIRVLRT